MSFLNNYDLAEPWWLLLLLVVPPLMYLGYRQGSRSWLIYPTLRVLSTLGLKPKDRPFRFAPLILPLMLIPAIIGLARPQETRSRTSRTASGIDIIIALDVSYSMSTADFYESEKGMRRPQLRINAAKKIITEFIDRRPDDRIGIVSFAARPYTVAPITLDHQILEYTLRDVALVKDRAEGGTAIGSAIVAAGDRLETLARETEKKDPKSVSKVIVLVTDGASNSGQLSPIEASGLVAELGIKVYPVGIGTPQGRIRGVNTGQEFDTETLKEIAMITGGDYYRARDYLGLREAFKSIDDLEKIEIERKSWIIRKELYFWFVGASAFLVFGYLSFSALNPPAMP